MNAISSLPRQVGLNAQIIKITQVNDAEASFDVTFLLYQKWIAPELNAAIGGATPGPGGEFIKLEGIVNWSDQWEPKLKFKNAIEVEMEYERTWVHHRSERNGDAVVWKYQRYRGRFYQYLQLAQFPFDAHDLCIVLDTAWNTSECVLVKRDDVPMSFSGREFGLSEWEFLDPVSQSGVEVSPTPSGAGRVHLQFSRFVLAVPVRRLTGYYFWNVFFTAAVLNILCLVGFALPANRENLDARLGIVLTILLSIIAFKFSIMDRLPRIPYLTTMDTYMLFSTLLTLVVAGENIAVVHWIASDYTSHFEHGVGGTVILGIFAANAFIVYRYVRSIRSTHVTTFRDEDLVYSWDRLQEFNDDVDDEKGEGEEEGEEGYHDDDDDEREEIEAGDKDERREKWSPRRRRRSGSRSGEEEEKGGGGPGKRRRRNGIRRQTRASSRRRGNRQ